MELHMQSHHWKRCMPDWLATNVAGLMDGTLVIMLEFSWSTMMFNESPWRPTHKIATVIMGRGALEEMSLFSFSVMGTALILHFVLGALMDMILGAIIAPFHFDSSPSMLAAVGVIFRIVTYVVNFCGMTAVSPWFVSEHDSGPLLASLLFGVMTAITYGMLERHMPESMY